MKKQCPECGDTYNGRADKKFCSDSCRSAHHNKLNSDSTNFIRKINNILRKNRRILAELNPDGKKKMHKDRLLTKGFNFKYFSSLYKTKDNRVYHFVYDQGYTELDNDWFLLVENKKGA